MRRQKKLLGYKTFKAVVISLFLILLLPNYLFGGALPKNAWTVKHNENSTKKRKFSVFTLFLERDPKAGNSLLNDVSNGFDRCLFKTIFLKMKVS